MFSKSRSLRFRLSLVFVLVFGAALIAFSTLLYRSFLSNNQALFDAELYNQAIDVSEAVDVDFFGDVRISEDPFSRRGRIFLYAIGKTLLQIRDSDGRVVVRSRGLGSGELPYSENERRILDQSGFNFTTLKKADLAKVPGKAGSEYRMLSYVVQKFPRDRFILQLAVPLTILEKEATNLLIFYLVTIPAALILAAFGGFFLSGKALAPINNIIEKARKLSHTNLSERLSVPKVDDELKQLTLTLNDLLDRLEKGFKAQERFVSDASHELRTPLAILRGELDLLKTSDRRSENVDAFIRSAAQEVERLSRLVEDLLILARADMSKTFFSMGQVRLDELAIEASSSLEKIATQKGVRIRLDFSPSVPGASEKVSDFEVRGDPDLLFSLLRNLIENAIKYSPANGIVTIRLVEEEGAVRLHVMDQGPGISPEALPRIFDRFYRSASASNEQGFGLGLAIVRQIVDVHQGKLEARSSSDQGTAILVEIKKF